MSTAIGAERLFERKERSVADAGQAAVFLKANVVVVTLIRFLEIQHTKTRNSPTIPELLPRFFVFFLQV
jgi:hypothetical protein